MHLGLELHKSEIERLPKILKAALAAACAQRQAEAYRAYKRRTGGSSAGFDDLIGAIWTDISSQKASEQEHKSWEARAEALYRGKNESLDMYAPNVECAVLSLLYTNDVLMHGHAQDVAYAAHHAFMSIREFLINSIGKKPQIPSTAPDSEERVSTHPLIRAEQHRQGRDLLEAQGAIQRQESLLTTVAGLRKRAEIDAHSFIPIIERTAS